MKRGWTAFVSGRGSYFFAHLRRALEFVGIGKLDDNGDELMRVATYPSSFVFEAHQIPRERHVGTEVLPYHLWLMVELEKQLLGHMKSSMRNREGVKARVDTPNFQLNHQGKTDTRSRHPQHRTKKSHASSTNLH
jgi:hypothetical protein